MKAKWFYITNLQGRYLVTFRNEEGRDTWSTDQADVHRFVTKAEAERVAKVLRDAGQFIWIRADA